MLGDLEAKVATSKKATRINEDSIPSLQRNSKDRTTEIEPSEKVATERITMDRAGADRALDILVLEKERS